MDEENFVHFLQDNFPCADEMGIGDDASVVARQRDPLTPWQLVSKDLLIENVHFSFDYFSLEQVALKSLAVNISDIAAMGGTAEHIYLGLGFPKGTPWEKIRSFFRGFKSGCVKWKVDLCGGDISRAPCWIISVTVTGNASRPVYRNSASPGDLIAVTGKTGESALGLDLLQKGITGNYFTDCHLNVEPELYAGPMLAEYASAMIDISDGLAKDLNRILTASGVGAQIDLETLPVSPVFLATCRDMGIDPYNLILSGGEDYKLLFTLSPESEKQLRQQKSAHTVIGRITRSPGSMVFLKKGKPAEIMVSGFDHFV